MSRGRGSRVEEGRLYKATANNSTDQGYGRGLAPDVTISTPQGPNVTISRTAVLSGGLLIGAASSVTALHIFIYPD